MSSNSNANRCIACTVTQCKHHCGSQNFCSLNEIRIGCHESDPTGCECTDCNSFETKN